MKKKIVAFMLVIAMVAIAAISGTLAYFTDTDSAINVMTVGNVDIEQIEQDIKGHLDLLEKLKNRDLTVTEKPAPRSKPYNFDEEEAPLVVKAETPRETTEEIANEIEQNITRLMDIGEPDPVQEKPSVSDSTMKFSNLQFGHNYDPTNG